MDEGRSKIGRGKKKREEEESYFLDFISGVSLLCFWSSFFHPVLMGT
jgi:hypothetical protein